jgi:hypothetical protein
MTAARRPAEMRPMYLNHAWSPWHRPLALGPAGGDTGGGRARRSVASSTAGAGTTGAGLPLAAAWYMWPARIALLIE